MENKILDSLPLMVLEEDFNGKVTYANPECLKFLNKNLEEVVGKTHGEALDCETLGAEDGSCGDNQRCQKECGIRKLIDDSMSTNDSSEEEVFFKINSSEKAFSFKIKSVPSNKNKKITLFIHDNSEMENLKEELLDAKEELQDFTYAVSHDFRGPLRIISAYSDLIIEEFVKEVTGDCEKYKRFIFKSIEQLQDQIDGLLKLSRVTTKGKKYERVGFKDLLEEVIEDFEVLIKNTGTKINYGSLPEITCEKEQMITALKCLIRNSIKFRGDKSPEINISVEPTENKFVFSFSDNGIGIDKLYWERIFIVFRKLHSDKKYSGAGLGLTLAKKIIQKHGGRIWLDSTQGEGTTFYFTLPQ